jgi:hypothetical protein
MSFEERRRRNGPIFRTHQRAHEGVLADEGWYGDGEPVIGKQFTTAKAKERKQTVTDLLFRTAEHEGRAGDAGVADRLAILADKLHYCCLHRRCGSLACTECLRAFQKAKVTAQEATIELLEAKRSLTFPRSTSPRSTCLKINISTRKETRLEFLR